MSELWAWMNGEPVGVWSHGRAGSDRFAYFDAWRASPQSRSLSLSMPLTATGAVDGAAVANYFDNLLPDSDDIRRRIRDRFRTQSTGAFELLQAIGRDCVGAVQLLPPDERPVGVRSLEYDPLGDGDVERILRGVTSGTGFNAADRDGVDFRLSIAGAQEKTALLRIGAQWCRPRGATPTTHILKLPLGLVGGRQLDLTHSVENEWLCMELLRFLGLPVARVEIRRFGEMKALVVERFDRRFVNDNTWIARLPQEDFCQALGKPPHQKYEADNGPTMRDCLAVLTGSAAPIADSTTFLCAQLAFWLLAATDGHAKNFSLHLERGDRYRLTPLYDVLSAWPVIGAGPHHLRWQKAKLAMAVRAKNVHYKLAEIQPRHWRTVAQKHGGAGMWQSMLAMLDRVDTAIEGVAARLPAGFPARTADKIFAGLRGQCDAFRSGLASE